MSRAGGTWSLPLSQETLRRTVLPRLREIGQTYEKSSRVHARPAVPGEVIVSVTDTGEETRNRAQPGDKVVENLTRAREQYLVSDETFGQRYRAVAELDDTWTEYAPLGKVRAIEITAELVARLGVGDEFLLLAPWGSEQSAQEGDFLVSPLPDLREVYRIAKSEFRQTYRPLGGDEATS